MKLSGDSSPIIPNYRKKEEKWKTVANKKAFSALTTRQSHAIEYKVSKIVPMRHWDRNKGPARMRGSTARRRKSIPMCRHI